MKQHIDLEQLDELSAKQKNKLYEYLDFGFSPVKFEVVRELTIGKMIEFLDEQKKVVLGDDGWNEPRLKFAKVNSDLSFDMDWSGELCDALWEACKETLNEQ
jgi:hypothetical protein